MFDRNSIAGGGFFQQSLRQGTVYLVGAGPGDPGLLTLRGHQCLSTADAVLYDYLVNPRLLDWAPNAEKICLGRHGRTRIWQQSEINAKLIELAQQGLRVVRLKSGDPTVFARGAEEAQALHEAKIAVEIIPGVTAALAAAACAGIPLTHRDVASAVALVTGRERDGKTEGIDFQQLARFPGTIAIYMGVTTAASWTSAMIEAGLSPATPAALIRRISYPDQATWTGELGELDDYIRTTGLRPPVIALVGPAAKQQLALGWFERRPLFGQRLMVTRPRHSADELAQLLEDLGAATLIQPAIAIEPPDAWDHVDRTIAQAASGSWDWIVFSSGNGVRHWLDRLLAQGDLRMLHNARIAAVGPATAETLSEYHLRADLVPQAFHAEGLAEAMRQAASCADPAPSAPRALLVRANRGRDVLPQQLAEQGMLVEQVAAYQSRDVTVPDPAVVEQLANGDVDWVLMTSSAIARSLAAMFGDLLNKTRLASISPITSATLRELGFEPAAEAQQHDMQGLVDAIINAVAGLRATTSSPMGQHDE